VPGSKAWKGITSISTYTHAKGLYIPFFAKFSFFNLFFVPLRVSSIYASTANSFSSANLTIQTDNPEEADIGFSLLAHISPIEWSNVVLYGENKLNRDLVRR
jgi:hypothetical protein